MKKLVLIAMAAVGFVYSANAQGAIDLSVVTIKPGVLTGFSSQSIAEYIIFCDAPWDQVCFILIKGNKCMIEPHQNGQSIGLFPVSNNDPNVQTNGNTVTYRFQKED